MRTLHRTTEHEVDRASFQMVNRDISLMFFHINDRGNIEYRAESFRGRTLKTQLNPRSTFENWCLSVIKESIENARVPA